MAQFLLDTSVCIAALRLEAKRIPAALASISVEGAALSSITIAELEVGANKGALAARRREELELLTHRLPVMDFDLAAARHYGEIRAYLEGRGTPIGPLDQLIAAHARSLGLILITTNLREFRRVPGLVCRSWTATSRS